MGVKKQAILGALALSLFTPGAFFLLSTPSKKMGFSNTRSTSSSTTDEEPLSRALEPGQISGQTKTVKNEPKVILNDPALQQAWGIEKSNALKAWEITQGSHEIIVAVIDTGCDIDHEDLAGNYWINPGENGKDKNGQSKQSNGRDDDGNGFKDDVYGWNFVSNNNDLTDNHGHGTHIAGIIGALANNGKGIVGIAPKVKIMCLKYYDPRIASDHLKNTVAAVEYAVKMGAHIINYSGGGLSPADEERLAIQKALDNGILFVAAAGNERSNSDVQKYYPADYGLPNIISVTAINPSSQVLPSSNYGTNTVDIAAPGQNILSTLPGSTYGYMTGTSQATAFVTGAAVLVKAHHPDFTYNDIKRYILSTGDSKDSLLAKTRTARQLNLFKSLTMMDSTSSLTGIIGFAPQTIPSSESTAPIDSGNTMQDFNQFSNDLMQKLRTTREAAERKN